MKRKVTYYAFSILLVLSATFSIAPLAFCSMKVEKQESSCCEHEVPTSTKCPICFLDQNTAQDQALFVKFQTASPTVLALIPHERIGQNFHHFFNHKVQHSFDTSPLLYLELGILRL